MLRRAVAILLLFVLLVPLLSCNGQGREPPATQPTRVAVLFSSLCEVWQAAGGTVAITVGESIERGLVPSGTPLVDQGAGKSINTELLLAECPDLVIYSPDVPAQVAAAEVCKAAGIDTLPLRIETFPDYVEAIEKAVELTNNTAAQDECERMRLKIEAVKATAVGNGRTVLFVRAGSTQSSTKAKTSADHFAAAMLTELGCHNIADDAPLLVDTLSTEAILSIDPDHIFFSMMGDEAAARANIEALLLRPEWQALKAVKENNVTILPRELFHFKPCGRYPLAYQFLADALREE